MTNDGDGLSGSAPGGGGSGPYQNSGGNDETGGGGGSGAYVRKVYNSGDLVSGSTISDLVVGAGGAVNTASEQDGGAGAVGRITVTCNSSPAAPEPLKKVFVTVSTYTGAQVGGETTADAHCQSRADGAGLTGTFKAWLGTSTGVDPNDTFASNTVGYELPNGTKVADNYADLTDGTLDAAINRDANGNLVGTVVVWTNVDEFGERAGSSGSSYLCNGGGGDWSSNNGIYDGGIGSSGSTTSTWTNNGTADCSFSRHLYCVEQ